MATSDPGRKLAWRAALLVLAVSTASTVALGAGAPPRVPGEGAAGLPGPGGAAGGPGRMGMVASDQHFIVMMIPHHDGAIAMADLALTRARHPEIRALASRIKTSQTRENAQMRAWYRQWYGQAVPAWPPGASWGWQGGMGGSMGLGMHGATNLTALRQAPDFDRAFIEQMIPHHQMGVMMASMAQAQAQHPELRQLQQAMVRVQSDEIQQMEQWYQSWYPAGR